MKDSIHRSLSRFDYISRNTHTHTCEIFGENIFLILDRDYLFISAVSHSISGGSKNVHAASVFSVTNITARNILRMLLYPVWHKSSFAFGFLILNAYVRRPWCNKRQVKYRWKKLQRAKGRLLTDSSFLQSMSRNDENEKNAMFVTVGMVWAMYRAFNYGGIDTGIAHFSCRSRFGDG